MAHDVFISYSRKDKAVVDLICEELRKNSISYWIDKEIIGMGETFSDKIVAAIKESRITVFVSSSESNMSHYTVKEITIAFKNNKHIIPFRIEDVPFASSLEFYLCDLNWVNAFPHYYLHIENLIQDIARLLSKTKVTIIGDVSKNDFCESINLNQINQTSTKFGKFIHKLFSDKS